MTTGRAVPSAVILAIATVGFAGQAGAENPRDLDGTTATGGKTFRWSDDLTGYGYTFSSTEACGKPPQPYDQFTFTLTKV